MGIYLANCSDLKKRRSQLVFYPKDGSFVVYREERKAFEIDSNWKTNVSHFLDYASSKKAPNFEILLPFEDKKDTPTFLSTLSLFANSILEEDISVGLLVKDYSLMANNYKRICELGIVCYLRNEPSNEAISTKADFLPLEFSNRPAPIEHSKIIKASSIWFSRKMPSMRGPVASLQLEESFHEKLLRFLNESGKDNVEVYSQGGISRQVFSSTLSSKDTVPSKATVICLIIGMHLPLKEAYELLQSAGYTLSNSLLFDAIILDHLKMGDYQLDHINRDLNDYDCPLLGWKPRKG